MQVARFLAREAKGLHDKSLSNAGWQETGLYRQVLDVLGQWDSGMGKRVPSARIPGPGTSENCICGLEVLELSQSQG